MSMSLSCIIAISSPYPFVPTAHTWNDIILQTSLKLDAFVDQESLGRLLQKQGLGTSGYHTRVRKAYSIILDFSNYFKDHRNFIIRTSTAKNAGMLSLRIYQTNAQDQSHWEKCLARPMNSGCFSVEEAKQTWRAHVAFVLEANWHMRGLKVGLTSEF